MTTRMNILQSLLAPGVALILPQCGMDYCRGLSFTLLALKSLVDYLCLALLVTAYVIHSDCFSNTRHGQLHKE